MTMSAEPASGSGPLSSSEALDQAASLMEEMNLALNQIYQQVANLSGIPSMDYGSELIAKGLVGAGFLLLIPPALPELEALSSMGAILTGVGATLGGIAAATTGAGIIVAITMGVIVISTSGETQQWIDLALDVSSGPFASLLAAAGSFLRNGAVEGTEQGARIGKLGEVIWEAGSTGYKLFRHEPVLMKASEVLHTAYTGVDLVASRPQVPYEQGDATANIARTLAARNFSHPSSFDLPHINGLSFDLTDLEKSLFAASRYSTSQIIPATLTPSPAELPIYLGGGTTNTFEIPDTLTDQESGMDDQGLSDQGQKGDGFIFILP